MVGLLGGLMPGEDPMQPAALVPRGLLEMLGPSVMSRMQAREKQQEARMAAGDRSPTPLDEEGMMLADDLAGGLLGTISRVDDLPEMIARLLREGRAAEVTDDLLARLGPNENARLVELYEAGATGMPMPMDEASRMARAREMGFDTEAFHASTASEPFGRFRPGSRGSTYFASTPNRAQRGADGGAQDLAHLSAAPTETAPRSTMPMRLRGDDVAGLRPSRQAWEALPEVADEADVQRLAQGVGGNYWWDVFDESQVRAPQWDAAETLVDPGQFEYRRLPYPAQQYSPTVRDWRASQAGSAHSFPAYSSGSDTASLARVRDAGQQGFVVLDEAGPSIVMSPDAPIRSRFARFDPRLKHNANLLASIGGLGLLGVQLDQQPEGNW